MRSIFTKLELEQTDIKHQMNKNECSKDNQLFQVLKEGCELFIFSKSYSKLYEYLKTITIFSRFKLILYLVRLQEHYKPTISQ